MTGKKQQAWGRGSRCNWILTLHSGDSELDSVVDATIIKDKNHPPYFIVRYDGNYRISRVYYKDDEAPGDARYAPCKQEPNGPYYALWEDLIGISSGADIEEGAEERISQTRHGQWRDMAFNDFIGQRYLNQELREELRAAFDAGIAIAMNKDKI